MAIIDKPTDYFNTKLYTGNGGTQSITGVGFQPDFNWTKSRTTTQSHVLTDAVRGVTKTLFTNATQAEATLSGITAFGTDGYTLGASDLWSENSTSFASWNWLGANGTASNTTGSIDSTVSANTTSGFSIVSYAGNSTAGATIGHSLGVAPKMIIVKDRDGADSWVVYHNSLAITEYLILNSTSAALTDNEVIFYDTDPTSSVFTVGAHNTVNQSGHNYIAYCFAEKQGYSKFGSYTGNGSTDGTFVYTGFKPAFVMIKATGLVKNWLTFDNRRLGYNGAGTNKQLHPNTNGTESSGNGTTLDILSNGFKTRTTDSDENGSGQNYIYMAFAENPFVASNFVPTTAR